MKQPKARLGREGRARFLSLLSAASDWELEQAALAASGVDFSLVSGPRRLELRLLRGAGGAVELSPRRGPRDIPAEDGAVLDALRPALAATDFVRLIGDLSRDCLLYSDPHGGSVPSRFQRYYRRVDHSEEFWRFVHPEARFLEQEVDFGARYAQVSHATLECRLNNPLLVVGSTRFFADDGRVKPEGDYSYADTTITEADVLSGRTQEILGGTLERVAREEKPAFIHLKTTCLPELIGDNPAPFIKRLEDELGVPVLWTSKTRNPGPGYERMVERLLEKGLASSRRDPRAVLLAGVSTPEAGREAAALCAEMGLRVAGTLFPNLDFRRAPALAEASAVVWVDPVGWEKIGDEPFLRQGLSVVRHHPPFGLAGTRGWMERAASVLGLEEPGVRAYERALARKAAGLEALAAECRRRTVVLAGDREDVELLSSRGRAFGFSVAGLLCELGFNVRCLVWRPAGADGRALRRAKAPRAAGTIEFVPFSTRRGLDRELGRGTDLAFSHFNHDPRLAAHGLHGFTDRAVEPGLDGLLRTGRRLLDKCAARPFAGRRGLLTPWIS